MLLPITEQSCLAVPDIDDGLLRIARGIDDARWMTWLEGLAVDQQGFQFIAGKNPPRRARRVEGYGASAGRSRRASGPS